MQEDITNYRMVLPITDDIKMDAGLLLVTVLVSVLCILASKRGQTMGDLLLKKIDKSNKELLEKLNIIDSKI